MYTSTLSWVSTMAGKTVGMMVKSYSVMMEYPHVSLGDWTQPHPLLLRLLSTLILYWFPVQSTSLEGGGRSMSMDYSRTIWVGNDSIYGFQTLSLLAVIYAKTGILPRWRVEPGHFVLPIWKHLIEAFGATVASVDELIQNRQSFVWCPGHVDECYTPTSSLWQGNSLKVAHDADYQIVPFGMVGMNFMVWPLFIETGPLFNVLKMLLDRVPRTLPLVFPISYQVQYLTLSPTQDVDLSQVQGTVSGLIDKSNALRESSDYSLVPLFLRQSYAFIESTLANLFRLPIIKKVLENGSVYMIQS